jgi:hypothetical protein
MRAGVSDNLGGVMSNETKNPVESVEDKLKRIQLENALLEQENLKEELDAKKAEKERRGLDIKKLKRDLEKDALATMQAQDDRKSQGRTFAQDDATDRYKWSVCTHRKGGVVSARDMRALTTGGSEDQYAVIKHQMINGDIWVRCMRCGKTWSPPVESNFYFRDGKMVAPVDGVFDKDAFTQAQKDYMVACQFPTRNSMSGSVQCRFLKYNPETGRQEDAADIYRENIKDTNLR